MKQKPKSEAKKTDAEIERLQAQIELLQKEKEEVFAKLQRVSADYANFQKRAPKHISDSITYEKELIIKTLLPVLDNFEHTLANADSSDQIDVLTKGIRIIYEQMLDVLKSHGVQQIIALGEKFDPSLHQAVMRKHDAEKEQDIVLEEYQKGYKLNGRVIRPSRVVVNKPPEEQPPEQQTEQQQICEQPPEQTKPQQALNNLHSEQGQ
jgi:molecular chaperone GrpE